MAERADWEAVWREYRAGALSVREIARQHGVSDTAIRKRARKEGWERDLTAAVQAETRAKLAREGDAETDREIVSEAASRGAEVVRSHRRDIGQARGIIGALMGQLTEAAANRREIEGEVQREAGEDGRRRAQMLRAVSLPQHASTARDLAQALRALVPLERQAFNIEAGGDENPRAWLDEIGRHPEASPQGRLAVERAQRIANNGGEHER